MTLSKAFKNQEYIKFFIFLAIVIILTPFLMDIIARSWKTEIMKGISDGIKTLDPSGTSVIITFVIGFYIGSSILLFIDRKKRVQAFVLLVGVGILLNYMLNNFAIGWNLIYIGLGCVIGIYLGGGFKKITKRSEFRRAATNVSTFSVVYASISLIIFYSSSNANNSSFIKDALVILIYSYFFGKLMGYEIKGPKIFILGPEQSGKTLFLAGCYKRVLDTTEISTKRSDALVDLIKELHKGWPKRTADILEYQFRYEIGRLFPREATLRSVDYPGVYLADILNYIDNKEDIKKIDKIGVKQRVIAAREVASADKLIFIIDCEKYPNFDEMGIDYYIKIVTKLRENGKEIRPYIVFTKSDLFKDEYPNYENDYEGFKKFIANKFLENIFIRELLVEASNTTFYPVFYYTKKMENLVSYFRDKENDKENEQKKFSYVPIKDPFGNVHTYGFDVFMDQLMEDG